MGIRVVHLGLGRTVTHMHYTVELSNYIQALGAGTNELFMGMKLESVTMNQNLTNYTVLVSSKTFHTLEYAIQFNETNQDFNMIPSPNVSNIRVFYRYSVYEASGNLFIAKGNEQDRGYFISSYILPTNTLQNSTNWTQQLLIAYDLNDYNSFGNTLLSTVSLNTPIVSSAAAIRSYVDQSGNLVNKVVMTSPLNGSLLQLNLNRNLTFEFNGDNGFNQVEMWVGNYYVCAGFNVSLIDNGNGSGDSTEYYWIIGLVVGLIVVAILIVVAVKKFGKKNKQDALLANQ